MATEKWRHIRDGADSGEMVVGGVFDDGLPGDFFGREDHTDARNHAHAVEAFAHHGGETAGVAVGYVGGTNLHGVKFAAAAHTADGGKPEAMGMIEKENLGRESVDAINHTVERCRLQQLNHAVVAKKLLQGSDLTLRIDVTKTVAKEECLGLSHCGVERNELSVYVGWGDRVAVNNSHAANACTA